MLAVFDQSVAKIPEGLQVAAEEGGESGAALVKEFSSTKEGAVTVGLGPSGFLAYTSEKQNPLYPRLFAAVDDMFCMFEGHVGNMPLCKQQYGLSKTANEVILVIEAYRTLRDRGPYSPDQVVRDLNGNFTFILLDNSSKIAFVAAADADGGVPFFWGADSEGHLVLSDDLEIMKKGCGKSFAPFPKGCFFTTSKGLQSFVHPLNEVKPVPRVDSQGDICGANYEVEAEAKKDRPPSLPRVGSTGDWSSHY